jgi:predicted  nucleic acid-binding Zn-ribbon protein
MNKTLLLIIIDFLFLNLIALTRWEKAEPAQPRQSPVTQVAANTPPQNQDLVDVMRLSLQDEQNSRTKLAQELQQAQATLENREQNLGQLQTAKAQLETSLATTQQSVKELSQRAATATEEATMSKEQLARLQRDLEQKQAEAARQQQQIAALTRQQAEAQQRIEGLNVAVKVAEQEKGLLQQNLQSARQQVEAERQEREKVLAQNTQLAQGVGQLAQKSGEIVQEMRDNRPINANVLFSDFLANRVFTTLTASRKRLFGTTVRTKEIRTVLVTDGKGVYALMHANDTPFPVQLDSPASDWEKISGQFGRPPVTTPVTDLQFLSLDPRLIVIPVDADLAARLGVKVYKTALEPFKFPEAMLIKNGGTGYGEVPFKLDQATPQYVRMDNRFIKHLVGDFTPSWGDLVFSKTGELIGMMVNNDYCAVLDNFLPSRTIKAGTDTTDQHTGAVLASLAARLQGLPLRLQ